MKGLEMNFEDGKIYYALVTINTGYNGPNNREIFYVESGELLGIYDNLEELKKDKPSDLFHTFFTLQAIVSDTCISFKKID